MDTNTDWAPVAGFTALLTKVHAQGTVIVRCDNCGSTSLDGGAIAHSRRCASKEQLQVKVTVTNNSDWRAERDYKKALLRGEAPARHADDEYDLVQGYRLGTFDGNSDF